MKTYFCDALKQNISVQIVKNQFGINKVNFILVDTGELITDICIGVDTGRKDTVFMNTVKYSWLYLFLLTNRIAIPTYNCCVKDNKVYEEFKL